MKIINQFGIYYAAFAESLLPFDGNIFTNPDHTKWKGVFNLQAHKYMGAMVLVWHLFNKQLGLWHLLLYFLPVYWLMKYTHVKHELLKGIGIYFGILALNGVILWI